MKEKRFYKKLIGSCVLMLCIAVVMIFTVFQADASDEGKTVKYLPNYIYDSSEYINSSTQEKIAPTDEGYLFAGWYTLEGTTYEPVEEPQENATYYAKFVPEEVLDIKAQVSKTLCDDVATNDGIGAIRFVTSLDNSKSYQKVGFNIKKGSNGTAEDAATTNYVYRTLYAVGATDGSGKTEEYKPEELFHSTSYYFKTWTITNIGEKSYNTDVTVTPYWITLDGTRVEGTKSIKTVNLGRSWLYVDTTATGSSELGTYKAPYKSIASAMAYQTELTPQVILKSDVDMTSQIDITKSLTLRGEDGNRSVSEKKTEPSVFTRNTSLTTTTDALLCVKSDNVTFENLTIDGNKNTTNKVRAIAVSTNATLNTKKVTVQNCNTSLMGGAIYLGTNSTLNISDSVVQNNASTSEGGAIYLANHAKMNITNSILQNNEAKAGGAIMTHGEITIEGNSIISQNKTSENGAAIFVHYYGDVIMNNGTISGNVAGTDTKAGNGGAVYLHYNATYGAGTMTMSGGTISGNTAGTGKKAGNGGGVCMAQNTSFTMTGGTISDNAATGNGGGIQMNATGAQVTISNTGVISGNTATGNGGAICNINGSTLTMNGGTISGNTAKGALGGGAVDVQGTFNMNDGIIEKNSADKNGGAMYIRKNGVMTMKDGEISGNTSKGGDGGGAVDVVAGGTFNMEGGTISGNTAPAGLAVFLSPSNNNTLAKMTMSGGEISGHHKASGTESHGGAIFVHSNAEFAMTGGTIKDNSTGKGDGGAIRLHYNSTAYGSGTHSGRGYMTMSGGSIEQNYAESGRGGALDIAGEFLMSGGTIQNNQAKANVAGAILVEATGKMTMSESAKIQNNTSKKEGGAIYHLAGGTLNIQGGKISENKSTTAAGGAILTYDTVTMSGGEISGNTAKTRGGAIFMHYNSKMTMSGGEISGNTAEGNGGAIFLHENDNGHSSMTMTSGTISNNISKGADGGGAIGVAEGSDFTIEGGTISGNKAAAGGAILTWGTVTMDGGTLSGNTVDGRGGAVFVHVTGTFNMSNGLITENTSVSHGGGVCLHRNKNGAGSMTMSGGSITENTAGVNGGGIVAISSENELHISGGSVTGNALNPDGKGVGPEIFAAGTVTSEKTLTIGNATVDNYVIVASSTENESAKYLQQQIKNLTGHNLTIETSSSNENQIIIQSGGNGESSGLNGLEFKLYLDGTKLYVCAGTAEQEIVAAKMLYTKYMSTDNVENFDTSKNPTISSLDFKFTCDWDAFTTTPSIVQAKSMHLNGEDSHTVLQGGCSDGTYAYYIMNNQTAGVGKEEQWTSYIYKVHLVTGAVQRSEAISLGHANSMTYNPVTNQLVVVIYQPDEPKCVKYVDAGTLVLGGVQEFNPYLINIAYNSSTGTYALGRRNADYLQYYEYDSGLTEHKITVTAAENITMQGKQDMECYNNKVFWLYSQDEDGKLLNTIYVCKWGGNSILYTIQPELRMEIENIFFYKNVGHTGYVIPGGLGALVTETIFYQQIQ